MSDESRAEAMLEAYAMAVERFAEMTAPPGCSPAEFAEVRDAVQDARRTLLSAWEADRSALASARAERDEARAAIDYAMSERHAMEAERDEARSAAARLRHEIVKAVAPLVADVGDLPEETVRRAVAWGLARDHLRRLCEERRQTAHILPAPEGQEDDR